MTVKRQSQKKRWVYMHDLLRSCSLTFLNAEKLHTHNKQCPLGHMERIFLSARLQALRYFQTLISSSVGHENFKRGIYWPSTPLQVLKKKWTAGMQRNAGERREWGWRERQGWSLSIITLMKKRLQKASEGVRGKKKKKSCQTHKNTSLKETSQN